MGYLMHRKCGLLNFVLPALLALTSVAANAAKSPDLFEMSEQMDAIDKQDFRAAIERATSCIRGRNFTCAESELAKAAKATSSGQDKKTLLASRQNLANEKQQLANEIRRAEEERKAEIRREEEREERYRRQEREAREAEDRESTSSAWADVGRHIQQVGAENMALLNRVDRQTIAAMNESNRIRAAQAAERERARAERDEREADRRREVAREREARERAARVKVAAAQGKPFSTYSQPQVIIEPTRQTCPPGSKPAGWTTPSTAVCLKDPQSSAGQEGTGQGSGGNSGGGNASGSMAGRTQGQNGTGQSSGGNGGGDNASGSTAGRTQTASSSGAGNSRADSSSTTGRGSSYENSNAGVIRGESAGAQNTQWRADSCGTYNVNETGSFTIAYRDRWWAAGKGRQDRNLGRCQTRQEIEALAHELAVKTVRSVKKSNGNSIALTIVEERFVCDNNPYLKGWDCVDYVITKTSDGRYYEPGSLIEFEK